ncbi:MAG TPA: DUF2934 domain-containing protein [Polyangia bacterium]|jgi:hypothetical protein|nr:DUF2934 domain-containing protein [Polyangia bacterium]
MKLTGRKTIKTDKTSAPMVKATKTAKTTRVPTHDEIAKRSYELFLARGGADGHHEQDWLQAEAELSGNA